MSKFGGVLARRRATVAAGTAVDYFTLTAPTAGGTTVYSPPGFSAAEPLRAVILFASGSAGGAGAGNLQWCLGFATRDAGATQQAYSLAYATDGAAQGDTARGLNSTSVLRGYASATGLDYDATISLTDTSLTITWADPPAAGIKIHGIAIGGSTVTAARCGIASIASSQATNDYSVGWTAGQPDLVLTAFNTTGTTTPGDSSTDHAALSLFAFTSDANPRGTIMTTFRATDPLIVDVAQKARAAMSTGSASGLSFEGTPAPRAQWPAQGFRIAYSPASTVSTDFLYLALKGTFTAAVGATTARTTAGTTDVSLGVPPKGAILWGSNQLANAGVITSATDLGAFWIGGTDGSSQGTAGVAQLDAATESQTSRWSSETRAVQEYAPTTGAPTLRGEASASFVGNALRLDWQDPDTQASELNYVLLG